MDEFVRTFACPPDEVLEIFADRDFLADFAAEVPVTVLGCDVRSVGADTLVALTWRFPTDRAPGGLNKFLPPEITLDWQTTWTPGPTPTATYRATATQPDVLFAGSSTLTPNGADGARWAVTGRATAKHPRLIPGAVVNQLLTRLFQSVLKDQAIVAERWIEKRQSS